MKRSEQPSTWRARAVVCALCAMLAGCGADASDGQRALLDPDSSADGSADARPREDAAQGDAPREDSTPPRDTPRDLADTSPPPQDSGGPVDTADTTPGDTGSDVDVTPPCPAPEGAHCNPIEITSWPYTDSRDTSAAPEATFDAYSCAPQTDESGGEFVYRFDAPQAGVLRASLNDVAGDSVDVDVQLLDALDAQRCLGRGNVEVSQMLAPGTHYIVVDTWVNAQGEAMSGPYTLSVDWMPLPGGACAMEASDLRMFWSDCDPNLDCYVGGGSEVFLRTPASGPVVKEAHLVTTMDGFGGSWPQSFTEGIPEHYDMSELVSGFATNRTEPWAPAGEGGSEYGQGSTGAPLPADAEAWYVNMFWRDRPSPGTRMLLINPANGLTVVAAAGYETGPGSNTAIGGAVEEIHLYLGTQHRETLIMGFLSDQSLPFGPIDCD